MTKYQKIQRYFNQKKKLNIKNKKYTEQLTLFVLCSLRLDLGKDGDITTNNLIKKNTQTKAIIMAKEKGIVAGLEEAIWLLKQNNLKVKKLKKDGDKIKHKDVLIDISGSVKNILKTERTVLNLMQRMSGIATQTNKVNKKIDNKILVCSTRKTQWGLLDKKAVVVGGGGTHRLGLHDFILIKENHLKFASSNLEKNVKNIKKKKLFWEIEVENETQALKIAKLNPDVMMLDNFGPEKIKQTVKKLNKKHPNIILEASGGINKNNIAKYKNSGADIISLGSLTHSVKALDIGLYIK